ncbi:MAG: hypothetical protein QQW96_15980 [Tychonema bourrellyi B0820]|uniref:hypothetical protein n=1 Tax=Tychonema bourrellyi TaxID=54313 RepID=UPI00117E700E|nr:hypothetical protein [Tychonema bourrellyi]MDQ2099133.1 hypothetical protein [Tychonema bourrellyi B0820]
MPHLEPGLRYISIQDTYNGSNPWVFGLDISTFQPIDQTKYGLVDSVWVNCGDAIDILKKY